MVLDLSMYFAEYRRIFKNIYFFTKTLSCIVVLAIFKDFQISRYIIYCTINYHDLRHSCASLLLANSVSLKEIQDWLGHSDYSTTANIYSHLEYGAKLKSAGKISETLNIKREKKDGK